MKRSVFLETSTPNVGFCMFCFIFACFFAEFLVIFVRPALASSKHDQSRQQHDTFEEDRRQPLPQGSAATFVYDMTCYKHEEFKVSKSQEYRSAMSDEPAQLPDLQALLRDTEQENQAERRVAELRGNALFSDAEASRERALTKRILLQAILQAPTPFEKMRRVSQPVAPVSHEESLNCGAGGVFHESQEKRPLTTQDILEHEDSFDCGGDAGDIVMGVQEDSFVPRRIRKKQPRPDGTRLPFFHHFFARTVLTAEEQQIIDDINAFGLCRLLHQWASGLLEYAQSAVQEELRYLASTSADKRDPFQDEFPQSSSTDVGCDWLLDRPTWHVEVLNSSTVSENEVAEKEDNVAGRQGFVSAEMCRDFLSAEDRRPKISDMPQNIVDLRHQVLSILQRIFKLHGRGVILDQIHVVRFSSSDHSRLKLGITTACDFSTSSLESSILET